MHQVTIWHNVAMDEGHPTGTLYGYRDADAVTPVFTYARTIRNAQHDSSTTSTQEYLAEDAFRLFNAPEEYLDQVKDLPIALRYRANRLRSLSVGDLVEVDGVFFACARTGFNRLITEFPYINVTENIFDNWKEEIR